MKNIIILSALFLLSLFTSCTDEPILGSGNVVSELRSVPMFTKVRSTGNFEVNITQGTNESLEIIADDNVISRVRTEVVNQELRIHLDDISYQGVSLRINIVNSRLNGLTYEGSGSIQASSIIEEGTFSVHNTGSGNIIIEGSAAGLLISNEGSGKVACFDFRVTNSTIAIDGSGDVETNCLDQLNAIIKGSGNVFYRGEPTIEKDITGTGDVVDANHTT